MPLVYLSLGSNIGKNIKDIAKNLADACLCLEEKVGKMILKSKLYQTKAWGVQNQADFCNQIILISTNLTPQMLLNVLLDIELSLGRVRKVRWGERIIDIDIIYFDDMIINDVINDTFGENTLIVPHPRMQERLFVLVPLAEIAPDFVHPILKKNNKELLSTCNDDLEVVIYGN
jgi:2-amino-4-hydroxy-6-hydroxymethyldihydropteridine diphosphokinase